MTADLGGYLWFVGLAVCLVGLAIAIVVSSRRRRAGVGDPNRAWRQEAEASRHPEVATPLRDPAAGRDGS